jgi:NADH:ubiquinone reductase (H+-translocating)
MAEITGIDAARRTVQTNDASLPFDFLVIATGTMHSYFGHDGWAAFARSRLDQHDTEGARQ